MANRRTKSPRRGAAASLDVSTLIKARGIVSVLLENGVDAHLAVDADGKILFANDRAALLFGYSKERLLRMPVQDLLPRAFRQGHTTFIRGFFENGTSRMMGSGREFQGLHADGTNVPVEIGLAPFKVGNRKLVLCSLRDIRQRKREQEALRLSESRASELQRTARIGNWDWNIAANTLWLSEEICRMLGAEPGSFGATLEAFLWYVHPDDRDRVNRAIERALHDNEPYSIKHRIVLADGAQKIVHEKAVVVMGATGEPERMVGTVQDVTDYARIEREVSKNEAHLQEAEKLARIGSWEYDLTDLHEWWSDGMYAILEEDRATFSSLFENFLQKVHPDDRNRVMRTRKHAIDNRVAAETLQLRLVMRNGREKIVSTHSAIRRDENGEPLVLLGTIHDVTERERAEARVQYLATHDEMTGLPNRSTFNALLGQAIGVAKRYGRKGAVLFIDLDGFKFINDSLGHLAGDELLRVISSRLARCLRQSDTAARLGGDEFCVLAGTVEEAVDASSLAERCLAVISEPVLVAGRELRPRASIGITIFPDDGQDAETVMKNADSAMYAAKADNQHRYEFYSRELTANAERRMALEHDLRRAIQAGEFILHYQPQVDLATGRMPSVEGLIRWNHPKRGLLRPGEFIEIAEKTGFIETLGDWVLKTACRDAVNWKTSHAKPLRVAVNISSQHFRDDRIVASVATALRETGLDPDLLEIEVTESVVQASDRAIRTFRRLRELGVRIAIDDFGTGYSCLESLRRLTIDTLKVDRHFTHDLLQSPELPAIIGTIMAMGRAMNLKVIAEGVETLEQVQYLSALGCERAQGYYFGEAVSSSEVVALLDHDFLPNQIHHSGTHLALPSAQNGHAAYDSK